MQTQPLPIQVSGASASPAPTRANGTANTDKAQFSQALSREMDQRQHSAAPAPAAGQPSPAKPNSAPAAQPPAPAKTAAPAQAKTADGKTASEAGAEEARDDAADAAAVSPVTDMLALVAIFNQPVATDPATDPVADPVTDPVVAAAAAQVAGLPGALGNQARNDAGIAVMAKPDGAPATDAAAAFASKLLPGDGERQVAAAGQTAETDGASTAAFKAAADNTALQGAPVTPGQLRTREVDVAALKELPAAAPLTAPAQQASTAIAQAVTATPADRIAARVGTPAWDNQVGQKIIWMVVGKEQSASLTLNPPDMGPMQVVLNVTNDQATVTFTAAQPEVRQALEDALPKLREMMGESGIALGNATVNAGSPDQRQAQQDGPSRGRSGGRRGGGGETAMAAVTAQPLRAGGAGLVDTFA